MASLKFRYIGEITISAKCLFHMLHVPNHFVDDVAVSKKDIWTDGHFLESGKTTITMNLISTFNTRF